jgi:dihydrofolate reductase
MRIVYYAAASLDGRIAGPEHHELTFLRTLSDGPAGYGYDEFFAGVDGLVMGASSWEFVARQSWPYGDRPTWVVTHSDELAPVEGAKVQRFSGDVRELVAELEAAGLQRVWLVGGGNIAAQFLAADRLDEVIVTLAPTFVGRGPSLADGDIPIRRFRLLSCERPGEGDGVQLRYERAD